MVSWFVGGAKWSFLCVDGPVNTFLSLDFFFVLGCECVVMKL